MTTAAASGSSKSMMFREAHIQKDIPIGNVKKTSAKRGTLSLFGHELFRCACIIVSLVEISNSDLAHLHTDVPCVTECT